MLALGFLLDTLYTPLAWIVIAIALLICVFLVMVLNKSDVKVGITVLATTLLVQAGVVVWVFIRTSMYKKL